QNSRQLIRHRRAYMRREASQAVIVSLSWLQCSMASMIAHAPASGRSSSPKAACGAPLGAGLYEHPHTGDHRDHVSRSPVEPSFLRIRSVREARDSILVSHLLILDAALPVRTSERALLLTRFRGTVFN